MHKEDQKGEREQRTRDGNKQEEVKREVATARSRTKRKEERGSRLEQEMIAEKEKEMAVARDGKVYMKSKKERK